jgi:hypothetical protein
VEQRDARMLARRTLGLRRGEGVWSDLMGKSPAQLEQERREDTAAAVASVVGARFRGRDIGVQQVHDFDLEFDDGAVEALEVCAFTDKTVREQWQVLDELDVVATQLTSTWTV